jgi:hypothetical protein
MISLLAIGWKSIIVVIAAVVIGIGSRYVITSFKEDNPIEEAAEQVVYQETGLNIDLSPTSPENQQKQEIQENKQ